MHKRSIACQGFWYRGAFVPAKDDVDEAILRFQFDYLEQHDEVIGDAEAMTLLGFKNVDSGHPLL